MDDNQGVLPSKDLPDIATPTKAVKKSHHVVVSFDGTEKRSLEHTPSEYSSVPTGNFTKEADDVDNLSTGAVGPLSV